MKTFVPFIFMLLLMVACKQPSIVKNKDFEPFLNAKYGQQKLEETLKEKDFWQSKLMADTGSYINKLELAYAHLGLFGNTTNVAHLLMADSLMARANNAIGNKNASIYFAQAQTAISRHGFRLAGSYVEKAASLQPDPYKLNLLRFDVSLELGRYQQAEESLKAISTKNSFDYLIRKAKWNDANGNLDSAISCMKFATTKAKATGNKMLIIWATTNLSEMLGHAGNIQESYNGYLEVLKMDSSNYYALKGIAWIAFSQDKNTRAAKRIYEWLYQQHPSPDYLLALAEIAEYEGHLQAVASYKKQFIDLVTAPQYGAMYNKYLIELYAELPAYQTKALELALQEVNERPTPETLNGQAWALYKLGKIDAAIELTNGKLNMFNHEPGAQWRTAQMLAGNGNKSEAKAMLLALLEASFELGPVTAELIREQLSVVNRE